MINYMNAKIENGNSKFDVVKLSVASILLIAGIVANSYFASQPVSLRLAGWILLLCAIALLVFNTNIGRRFWAFAQDAKIELRKVVWPTRQETIQTTITIMVIVVIVSLVLWGVDSLLLQAVAFLTGQRG